VTPFLSDSAAVAHPPGSNRRCVARDDAGCPGHLMRFLAD
jgi:hypothetical protein